MPNACRRTSVNQNRTPLLRGAGARRLPAGDECYDESRGDVRPCYPAQTAQVLKVITSRPSNRKSNPEMSSSGGGLHRCLVGGPEGPLCHPLSLEHSMFVTTMAPGNDWPGLGATLINQLPACRCDERVAPVHTRARGTSFSDITSKAGRPQPRCSRGGIAAIVQSENADTFKDALRALARWACFRFFSCTGIAW